MDSGVKIMNIEKALEEMNKCYEYEIKARLIMELFLLVVEVKNND